MSTRFNRDPRDTNTAEVPRLCAHPECLEDGLHPAPKNRNRLRDYFWFCKQHAREYNAAWDYCRGMGQGEIDRIIRSDTVWGRPTWPLGMHQSASKARADFSMKDATGIFDEEDQAVDSDPPDASISGTEMWAVRVLGLSQPLSLTALKARYKELAKLFHPDLNGGDIQAEERLKRINLAYSTLRTKLS